MTPINTAYFLGSLHECPETVGEMQRLLGCSRAAAYRWLRFIREFEAPKRDGESRISDAFKTWAQRA